MVVMQRFLVVVLATGAQARNHLPEGVKKESGKKLVDLYPSEIIGFLLVCLFFLLLRDLMYHRPPGDVKKEPG